MTWAFIAGGVVVSLIVLVVVIGALLPRDHVATVSARIAATPDAIWDVITDVAGHPSWRSDVQRIEVLPSTATGASWREHSKNGALTMVVDHADAPRRLVTRIADANLPFGGQWEYAIEADGADSSRVTITERGSVYNPVFRFVSRFIMGHTATMETYLRSLGRKFGDEPTPVVVASRH